MAQTQSSRGITGGQYELLKGVEELNNEPNLIQLLNHLERKRRQELGFSNPQTANSYRSRVRRMIRYGYLEQTPWNGLKLTATGEQALAAREQKSG